MDNMQEEKPCYVTKGPKVTAQADWQIKLGIIANTNREEFSSEKEYKKYIEEATQCAIADQEEYIKAAWKKFEKQTPKQH